MATYSDRGTYRVVRISGDNVGTNNERTIYTAPSQTSKLAYAVFNFKAMRSTTTTATNTVNVSIRSLNNNVIASYSSLGVTLNTNIDQAFLFNWNINISTVPSVFSQANRICNINGDVNTFAGGGQILHVFGNSFLVLSGERLTAQTNFGGTNTINYDVIEFYTA